MAYGRETGCTLWHTGSASCGSVYDIPNNFMKFPRKLISVCIGSDFASLAGMRVVRMPARALGNLFSLYYLGSGAWLTGIIVCSVIVFWYCFSWIYMAYWYYCCWIYEAFWYFLGSMDMPA